MHLPVTWAATLMASFMGLLLQGTGHLAWKAPCETLHGEGWPCTVHSVPDCGQCDGFCHLLNSPGNVAAPSGLLGPMLFRRAFAANHGGVGGNECKRESCRSLRRFSIPCGMIRNCAALFAGPGSATECLLSGVWLLGAPAGRIRPLLLPLGFGLWCSAGRSFTTWAGCTGRICSLSPFLRNLRCGRPLINDN